ncbi:hypothetical protein BS78_06G002300 [Paspalum vaginatum]|nr:hypothetical protein BS78_06G002300 [Paspalum vaginatum]
MGSPSTLFSGFQDWILDPISLPLPNAKGNLYTPFPSTRTPLRSIFSTFSSSSRMQIQCKSHKSPFVVWKKGDGGRRWRLERKKSRCGVCSRGVKSGGSAAVFTAECSHAFHFPCIAAHARSSASAAAGVLCCPVCASPWRQAPFLASLRLHCSFHDDKHNRASKAAPASAAAGPKLYDDDEPLLAPKAAASGGGGFNPIPEADDEDDYEAAEAAEFRGFFPGRPRASGPAVTVAPEAALVSSGRRHGRYVVAVKVRAPGQAAAPRRAPIDLVTVLDVSQGMVGEKLQALKRGMRLVVASLGPADRLAIVAFSGAAKRLLPLRRMTRTGQRAARQIVDRLVVCAAAATAQGQEHQGQQQPSACVGDALRKATKVLEDRRDRNPVATVMLLSDTQQQQQTQADGNSTTTRKQFGGRPAVAPATRFTHVEIPIGPGDAPPLVAAEEETDSEPPVEHAFAKCLGGLVSVVMQEVHLELAFPAGEITAVYACGPGGQQAAAVSGCGGAGVTTVRLGEMYAEEERELLVELRAPLAQAHGGHPHALSARCSYRDPASQEAVRGAEQALPLPALQAAASRRLHDLFVATRAVAEARRLAELQDLATAVHLLSSARALVLQSPPTQQRQELVGTLDTELSDMRWRRGQQQTEQPLTPTSSSRSGRRRRADGGETATPVGTPRAGSGSGSGSAGPPEPLTPTSAWRAAEQLAKVAIMRKSMNRVSDLHGFENARF